MSTREQTIMICDGCSLEEQEPRVVTPDSWVEVSRPNIHARRHYCADCWSVAILAILERQRTVRGD